MGTVNYNTSMTCRKCGWEKPVAGFVRSDRRGSVGRLSICTDCHAAQSAKNAAGERPMILGPIPEPEPDSANTDAIKARFKRVRVALPVPLDEPLPATPAIRDTRHTTLAPVRMPEGWRVGNPLPNWHPWKRDDTEWLAYLERERLRLRPINPNRDRFDIRLTPELRGQMNDLIAEHEIPGSEVIRRAVAEYHWTRILGRTVPDDDVLALDAGD